MFDKLLDYSGDDIVFPTYDDYCRDVNKKAVTKAMDEYIAVNWNTLTTIRVVPLNSNPMNEDSDGDGLLDGKPQKSLNGNIIAPADPHPMDSDGDIWKQHIASASTAVIPTELGDWYGYTKIDFEKKTGIEGFIAAIAEIGYLLVDAANEVVNSRLTKLAGGAILAMLSGDMDGFNLCMQMMYDEIDRLTPSEEEFKEEWNYILTSLGSRALNFKLNGGCFCYYDRLAQC